MIPRERVLDALDGYERIIAGCLRDESSFEDTLAFYSILPSEFLAMNLIIAAQEVAMRRDAAGDTGPWLADGLNAEVERDCG